jgi:predicted glycosyltransferase
MTKMLVYSHDTFGLGNIRRMLAICTHMVENLPELSVLLVTGSPFIHAFRLPARLDYIKLPTLTRSDKETYRTKYLDMDLPVTISMRSDILLNAVKGFRPELILVDKKPLGIKNELKAAFTYLKRQHSGARSLLILRDILDSAESTIRTWRQRGYYDAIARWYDGVAVLGTPEIYDACREYQMPDGLIQKTHYCGYIRRELARRDCAEIRSELGLRADEPFVLVTAGGGEDSESIMERYLAALPYLERLLPDSTSLLIHGPAIPEAVRNRLQQNRSGRARVILRDFTDDLISYMAAADVVISMGGYNTVCELLSLGKRAIIVPRVRPVREQWIRARRMEKLGFFRVIHPDALTPETLAHAVESELARPARDSMPWVDMTALDRLVGLVRVLGAKDISPAEAPVLPLPLLDTPSTNLARLEAR